MIDREKIIEAVDEAFEMYRSEYEGTSYFDEKEWAENKRDALFLLKEQEPRVITLDELTEIFVEFKGDSCPIRLSNFDLQKIIMDAGDGVCRLWIGKPTCEQMEAVKWDDSD